MSEIGDTRFSQPLNLHFYEKLDGSVHFEDGVVYEAHEVYQLKRLRSELKNEEKYIEYANKLHKLKKFFDADIGLIMPLN
jgi:virulence-associated protein VapD